MLRRSSSKGDTITADCCGTLRNISMNCPCFSSATSTILRHSNVAFSSSSLTSAEINHNLQNYQREEGTASPYIVIINALQPLRVSRSCYTGTGDITFLFGLTIHYPISEFSRWAWSSRSGLLRRKWGHVVNVIPVLKMRWFTSSHLSWLQ